MMVMNRPFMKDNPFNLGVIPVVVFLGFSFIIFIPLSAMVSVSFCLAPFVPK